ncbi:MAG: transposase [Ignavibacterium sp.]|nr:MAG: transposase [Ignavibacterium sp.]
MKNKRKTISDYFYKYSKEKNIYMKINHINAEHVHVLIDLPSNLSIEECAKLLKGSSSHFINSNRLLNHKFSWGRGYGAFSVSESSVSKVINYIKIQDEHHRTKSFSEEYELFIKKYGIRNNKNG